VETVDQLRRRSSLDAVDGGGPVGEQTSDQQPMPCMAVLAEVTEMARASIADATYNTSASTTPPSARCTGAVGRLI
jgi:hypothetical protein